jgi:hypothetical protein
VYAGIKDSLLSSKGGPPGSAKAGVYYAFELIHAERAISVAHVLNFSSHISASSLSI